MNAVFYTFAKKINSTLLPSGGGTTFSINLKDLTSIIRPVIRLNTSNPTAYNYCYVAAFGRYYFVSDWVSETNNIWSATLIIDVLASWRTTILNSSQFVLRSASETDSDIVDMMYPTTTKVTFAKTTFSTRPIGNELRYIIAVSNANSNQKVGGCTYYNLTYGQFANVMSLLLGSSSYLGDFSLDSISDSLVKSLVNPLQYFGETFILPYNIGDATLDLLTCGWWVVDTNYGYPVLTNSKVLHRHELWRSDLVVPAHPQSVANGSFMNCQPYTEHYLYAGVFGMIQLDSTELHNCNRVELVLYGDFKGNLELEIYGHTMTGGSLTSKLLDRRTTNCAIPINITQSNNKPEGALNLGLSTLGALGHAATANPKGLCADIANGLESAQDFFIPKSEGKPAVGSFATALEDWEVTTVFKNITDIAPNLCGKPLCQDKILSTLNGYTKCNNAYIAIEGTKEESDMIVNYLNGGFFIDT